MNPSSHSYSPTVRPGSRTPTRETDDRTRVRRRVTATIRPSGRRIDPAETALEASRPPDELDSRRIELVRSARGRRDDDLVDHDGDQLPPPVQAALGPGLSQRGDVVGQRRQDRAFLKLGQSPLTCLDAIVQSLLGREEVGSVKNAVIVVVVSWPRAARSCSSPATNSRSSVPVCLEVDRRALANSGESRAANTASTTNASNGSAT